MANKERGEVRLTVDGKSYTLKLGTNEAAEASPYMNGKSIFEVDLQDMACFRALLFVMVKGQNGISTIEDAGNLIDEDPTACAKAVNEAASLFFQRWMQNQQAVPAAQ